MTLIADRRFRRCGGYDDSHTPSCVRAGALEQHGEQCIAELATQSMQKAKRKQTKQGASKYDSKCISPENEVGTNTGKRSHYDDGKRQHRQREEV